MKDKGSNQFAKSCETIYVNLCEDRTVQNKPVLKRRAAKRTESGHCRVCKAQDGHKHVCPECGKCSKAPSDFIKHFRTHTGERPFECEVCGQGFKESSSMYKHRREKHMIHGPVLKHGRRVFRVTKFATPPIVDDEEITQDY